MRRFDVGDAVVVTMARNNCFAFQEGESPHIAAVVTYSPGDTGDLWGFRTAGGVDFRVNPQASDFIGIVAVGPDTGLEV